MHNRHDDHTGHRGDHIHGGIHELEHVPWHVRIHGVHSFPEDGRICLHDVLRTCQCLHACGVRTMHDQQILIKR